MNPGQNFAAFRKLFFSLRGGPAITALFLFVVVALFLIPIPPRLLDILLAANLGLSLTILLRSMFIARPTHIHSFPTVLLLLTLLRLALNVSSTRLILLHGDHGTDAAGRVIQSFGSFVMQGEVLVGAIVFVVIAVVNFLVISRGAARVAEVAARFVLDALPGRQFAIDAELRSGNLSREDAQQAQAELQQESQFYGAMDGAMRFVQGDAIAGLVITSINALGGLGVGLSRGMTLQDAVETFGVLAVGDGLVHIFPALFVAVAAGIVLTHVHGTGDTNTSRNLFGNVVDEPQALLVAAGALVFLSLIPGFPLWPFLLIGLLLLWRSMKDRRVGAPNSQQALPGPDGVRPLLPGGVAEQAVLQLRLSPQLFPECSANTLSRLVHERAYELRGVIFPEITVQSSAVLDSSEAVIYVRGQEALRIEAFPVAMFVCLSNQQVEQLKLDVLAEGVHPLTRLPGVWVSTLAQIPLPSVERLRLEDFLAYAVLAAGFDLIEELFGIDESSRLFKTLRRKHPALAGEVFDRAIVTPAECTELLRHLLRERVSIRDLKLICEGIVEWNAIGLADESRKEQLQALHAFVRLALSRSLIFSVQNARGQLNGFVLSTEAEEEFRAVLPYWDAGRARLPLDPEDERSLRAEVERSFAPLIKSGALPLVVICAADIREAVQEFLATVLESREMFRVFALNELRPGVQLSVQGEIGLTGTTKIDHEVERV